jgi:hypothetical protein
MSEITLGGERLGSGKKEKIYLRNYERSSHDLSYKWKSTIAPGVLVPFMKLVALPGDTFDINLFADALTGPTIGPLFGSFKMQVDIFKVPIRLYQAKLHMNALNIGMDMDSIKLPLLKIATPATSGNEDWSNYQISPSSLLGHFGLSGLGRNAGGSNRYINAIPILAYYDIYKQYFSNKQEEIGYFVHTVTTDNDFAITSGTFNDGSGNTVSVPITTSTADLPLNLQSSIEVNYTGTGTIDPNTIIIEFSNDGGTTWQKLFLNQLYDSSNVLLSGTCTFTDLLPIWNGVELTVRSLDVEVVPSAGVDRTPELKQFDLADIDTMREDILQHFSATAFTIDRTSGYTPYSDIIELNTTDRLTSSAYKMEGLACKTYQSDLFNNWISTEWIDGTGGVAEVTAIDTSGGSFTIDELNLANKVYNMLNRIALSGGTYDDWLDAVYTHDRTRTDENPSYQGGLIQELYFQEIVSQGNSINPLTGNNDPLGTLAGRGKLSNERKGGEVIVKVDEPCYIIGLVSLTPRIDYSQGNDFDWNLTSMNDFHKPALDAIGFQDLVTDQMAWFDTTISSEVCTYSSAGKQPAWINYMTAVDVARGNFAEVNEQMFMTLNRRYEGDNNGLVDLTTYIDPAKFNYIFADRRLDAQNFWVQINSKIIARRKMSAKVIPNL